jgi:3-deoxy-manno-octulosonate cytidylyltransferase (CMP-KDO synthetase)
MNKNVKILIGIPARYGSTRFPGKPLAKVNGTEMILHVYKIAKMVEAKFENCLAVVATEDERIMNFCKEHNVECVMTSPDCATGTDRIADTIKQLGINPEFAVNMQGDTICPPWFIEAVVGAYVKDSNVQVVTPCVNLTWDELDRMRENKKTTPFTGTCAVVNHETMDAYWFSKNIIPCMRKEKDLREKSEKSPVLRHIGLYGYRTDILHRIATLPESFYEKGSLEGLEQLRFIENGIKVRVVEVDYRGLPAEMAGVDSPEDVAKAEAFLNKYGDKLVC